MKIKPDWNPGRTVGRACLSLACCLFAAGVAAQSVVLNELQVSTAGTDWEFFEVAGAPGTDLSGLWLLSIESDAGTSNAGKIDGVVQLGGIVPDDGFWWAVSPSGQEAYGAACGTADGSFDNNTFENSSTTNLLVSGFSGNAGDDLDMDDDGVLDSTPWVSLVDGIAVQDSASDFSYGFTARGPSGSFLPSGLFRTPDGGAWSDTFLNFSDPDGTPGASNVTGCVPPPPPPPPALRLISEVQGPGLASPLEGESVTVQAIVVGDLQESGELDGFFIQEEAFDEDGDPLTSEGLFVYCGRGGVDCPDVALGNLVTVSGAVDEFRGLTQIDDDNGDLAVSVESADNNRDQVAVASLRFPFTTVDELESFEGMAVDVTSDMRVVEYFNFDRFSELRVWTDGTGADRPYQASQLYPPATVDITAVQADFLAQSVLLDDGSSRQNIGKLFPRNDLDTPIFGDDSFAPGKPSGGFRGGDVVSGIEGVMSEGFGNYRIHISDLSAEAAIDGEPFDLVVTSTNPRDGATETVNGSLTVASLNVLNYFTTIDDGTSDVCGAGQDLACRGADSVSELERQQAKIVASLAAIDADIVGLIEIENTPGVSAEQTLVDALNATVTSRRYAAVDTGVIGTDAIKVALIYDTMTVEAVGDPAVLDDPAFVSPLTPDPKNRPALAQTFRERASDGSLTVAVNHLKSKGSGCGADDDDPVQGSCNATREAAAQALAAWLATDPTDSGEKEPNVLIIGDLNSYAMEDPITALADAGYTDLLQAFEGMGAYGYVFDGRWGTLDYALSNGALNRYVVGAASWHINADEPDAIDYDESFKPSAWFEGDAFRSSDHDPVVVGISFCKGGGWRDLVDGEGNAFVNQGQCIRYINTGKAQAAKSGKGKGKGK